MLSCSGSKEITVTGISVTPSSVAMHPGETSSISAVVSPDNATDPAFTWSSSNPSVATCSNGIITAHALGTATITATTNKGSFKSDCNVTVIPLTYSVFYVTNGGIPELHKVDVIPGDTVLQPDVSRNYHTIEGWYADSDFTNKIAFPHIINQDTTLYAKWLLTQPSFDVNYTNGKATINLTNLYHNDIFLVKTNLSSTLCSAANTGHVEGAPVNDKKLSKDWFSYFNSFELKADESIEKTYVVTDSLPIGQKPDEIGVSETKLRASTKALPIVGSNRTFYAYYVPNSRGYVALTATMRSEGQYCRVWTANDLSDSNYTSDNIQKVTYGFDTIYPLLTNLTGYEYGGGPDGDGGMDGDPKVNILFHEMSGAVGYYKPIDLFPRSYIPGKLGYSIYSNEAEVINISSSYITSFNAYSSIIRPLIHELQHAISGANKYGYYNSHPAWLEESAARAAEFVILETLNDFQYIPTTLNYFISSPNQDCYNLRRTYNVYPMRYFIGNYGGPEFLSRLQYGSYVGVDSINYALDQFANGLTLRDALSNYGEAFIYNNSTPGVTTFQQETSYTKNGVIYKTSGFDIINMRSYYYNNDYQYTDGIGPYYYPLNQYDMEAFSISVHTTDSWKNKSGNFSVILEQPKDSNVILKIYIR